MSRDWVHLAPQTAPSSLKPQLVGLVPNYELWVMEGRFDTLPAVTGMQNWSDRTVMSQLGGSGRAGALASYAPWWKHLNQLGVCDSGCLDATVASLALCWLGSIVLPLNYPQSLS